MIYPRGVRLHSIDGPRRVLITGATGAIGPRIVDAFQRAGCEVRSFSLDAPASSAFPEGVEVMLGDVTDYQAVNNAVMGVDAILHLAALLHILNPPPDLRPKYDHVNVGGTAVITEAALRNGVKRVVLFSTIAVYGSGDAKGRILSEDSSPHPDTYYAETKLAAEQIVLNANRSDGKPLGVVLRLGAVYGSRIKGNYERLVHALSCRRFLPIGNGDNRRTLVYEKDVARAAVLATQQHAAAGRIYNVTDGEFHSVSEIIDAICVALGRRPPRFSVPLGPIRMAADLSEWGARLVGCCSPALGAMIDKYIEDVAVDGCLIKTELGFRPEYDLYKGWQETIREMHESGEL